MKTIKRILPLFFLLSLSFGARAYVLFDDASNYPYADGLIATQGQWYVYYPKPANGDAFVTNNVLILNSTNKDSVGAPTNGWSNPTEFNYASFRIKVDQLPATPNGGYFCELQETNDYVDCCHVFIDTLGTTVPGTFRLGIGNYATSFNSGAPPNNYPEDLATDVWYNVVILFDTNQNSAVVGATLWVNPSEDDYLNAASGGGFDGIGMGFAYGTDRVPNSDTNHLDIENTQIGFSPYANAGISNVIAGTTFNDVNSTNLPEFGIQPQSATNYSGNPTTFYAVASGVDLTYQWYSTTFGQLSDGANYTGSASDTLTVNSQTASDTYYCVVTDAYGNTATSSNAVDTVNTTLTPVFFPASLLPTTNVANLFTSTGFTNTALGTGPIYYQWYFAPTNAPTTFSPLSGQNSPAFNVFLADTTSQGNYFLLASNSVGGGTIALGPTNTLVEIAPLIATMLQLHNLEVSYTNQIAAKPTGTIIINSNNVTVSGYVAEYNGFGSSTYSEYFIEDASGLGCEVYCGEGTPGFATTSGNTNTPPVGTYITVSAPLEIFESTLELAPSSLASITTNPPPPGERLAPRVANSIFNSLVTNTTGSNALFYCCSLVTFTNCYLYGNKTGGAFGSGTGSAQTHSGVGGVFDTNTYTEIFFTVGGPYQAGVNTNVMEIFQPCYNYGVSPFPVTPSPLAGQPIPTYCYQLTGAYDLFGTTPELEPSRLADYVGTAPPSFVVSMTESNRVPTIHWTPQVGSTYSVYSAANILGPWTQAAYGLTYFPTNGAFTDTNKSPAKFYYITSP